MVPRVPVATRRSLRSRGGGFAFAILIAAALAGVQARQAPAGAVAIDPDDIGGVVEGSRGPEAGVWVIAETDSLPTKFRKIVVTDDRGRFLLPDLPRGSYRVWVRGYGLVDSKPVTSNPGRTVRLTAVVAPTPQAAAQIYPPSYWHSLLEAPPKSEFPGTGEKGNGIPTWVRSQSDWLYGVKVACNNCHQMGDVLTRRTDHLKGYKNSIELWNARLMFGQRYETKVSIAQGFGWASAAKAYASWTDRIARGEVPEQPPRPEGVERNIVLTMWDWGSTVSYVHDLISTDKRRPTVNPNGLIYGVDFGRDYLTILDPVEGKATEIRVPLREDAKGRSHFPHLKPHPPSPFWGSEVIWDNPISPHNPMMDSKGRVWMTQYDAAGTPDNPSLAPEFCGKGSQHPSAKFFPIVGSDAFGGNAGGRQIGVYDPKTQKFEIIDTCFGTHHLQFDEDADETLYFSGGGSGVGWFNTRVWDETKDPAKSQGWCPMVIDTNGDGKAGPTWATEKPAAFARVIGYKGDVRREAPPGQDLRALGTGYGLVVNPVDHSVWHANPTPHPGALIRYDPKTCVAEIYEPPTGLPQDPMKHGSIPRGVDVDRNGVIWTALAGTGHTASFDRRKCKVLNGPTATGQHCPEGWTLYLSPGPRFKGVPEAGSADYHYYNWVDQFDTFGLGENVPITNGTASDSLIALDPKTGKQTILRVPYPSGFFTRGLDGRIDDPKTGWKGRGLWANNATNTVWHVEGGKGTKGEVVHFQLRPNPLAK